MTKTLLKYLLLLAIAVPCTLASSCGPPEHPIYYPPGGDPGDNPGDDPKDEPGDDPIDPPAVGGWAELPAMEDIEGVVYLTYFVSEDGMQMAEPTDEGRKRNMTIAFDTGRHAPRWVAYPMHTWYWNPRTTARTDTWDWDPTLPRDVQPDIVTNGSYWQQAPDGAFSRGHMLASADRLRSVPMNTQTFYVSNLAPQVNDNFNDGVWADLEFDVRDWSGSATDTLYCVTGVAFEWDKVTYDKRSPRMEVKVPSHFYKVLLQAKSPSGKHVSQLSASELRCIGFWFENKAQRGATVGAAVMSVTDIEERVDLKFFPMLSAEAESVKESVVLSDWGL